jgi:hypothetical protein
VTGHGFFGAGLIRYEQSKTGYTHLNHHHQSVLIESSQIDLGFISTLHPRSSIHLILGDGVAIDIAE